MSPVELLRAGLARLPGVTQSALRFGARGPAGNTTPEVRHMLVATGHRGVICVEVPRKPRQLTNCNCSICRRYGTLWAY